jgi:hypothetical protein
MIIQNAENFTVFCGPPSPKAMARRRFDEGGSLIHPTLQLKSFRGSGLQNERLLGKGCL